jgi:Mg/Co/Ni transporter MgtE
MKKRKAKPLFQTPDPNDARKAIIKEFERQKRNLIEEDAGLEDLVQLTETLKKQSKKKR